jgi:nucleoside-diphosphate-sugar epimerase
VIALTSSAGRQAELRGLGVLPVVGDLDRPRTLARWRALAVLGDALLHLAPPPASGACDTRSRHLRATLAMAPRLRRVVYGSTTGVYGDAGGAWVDETRPVAPATDRARRRVDAEACWREAARRRARMAGRTGHGGHAGHGGHPAAAPPWTVLLLRIPGIYAADRAGGHPSERLRRGTPVLRPEDDVHTNHIHADDLARACVAALWRGGPQRVVHVSDDTELTMGAYFRLAAELCDLPAPPQISRAEAARSLGPMQLSFMGESRRLRNRRLKAELRLRLRHPTVHTGLLDGWPAADPAAGPA